MNILGIVVFIIILGVLIFVHELGHFLFAKKFGVRVDEFSVGFPPRIWSKIKNGTKYTLGLIPIGGYVKIFGEDPTEEGALDSNSGDSIQNKHRIQQAIIMVAGVLFNVVFAWILISFLFVVGFDVPGNNDQRAKVVVEDVMESSPAKDAGLLNGDVILSAGLESNAKTDLYDYKQFIDLVRGSEGQKVVLDILRNNQELEINLLPEKNPEGVFMVGAYTYSHLSLKSPWYLAPWEGLKYTAYVSQKILYGVGDMISKLFNGESKTVADSVSGPVGIARYVQQITKSGIIAVIQFTAVISLNLAIINILPFPALDGGRLLVIGIEAIIRRKLPEKAVGYVHAAGLIFLLGLMVLITILDIKKL
jgi:regulator of sigma E protease